MLAQTNNHKKKSFLATTILFLIFFLLLFCFKFETQKSIPDFEGGGGGGDIAVNFGDSDVGMGNNLESIEKVIQKTEKVSEPETTPNEVLTNESDNEVPIITNVKKIKTEPKKPIEKPVFDSKPKISKSTNDALSNILNANSKSGDGNDNVAGNKGKTSGNANSDGYNGGGGSGGGNGGGNGSGQGIGTGSGYGSGIGGGNGSGNGNYQLSGRKALKKPNPNYNCNEQGIVVVQISVNNAGQVVDAVAGVKGSTNTAKCLTEQAKIAAMSTKFNANDDAPEKQTGKIIYNFKLSE